jgi:hypothetical protein
VARLRQGPGVVDALESIIASRHDAQDEAEAADGARRTFFTELKADPGKLGLETLLAEITKLMRVRAVGLPPDLFTDVPQWRIEVWKNRALVEYPSTLRRDHTPEVRLTLLAVLCWCRLTEITDSLIQLFVDLVNKINTRAERRVDKAQMQEFKRVSNKETVLFKLVRAALAHPDEKVRQALWPVVGEDTLQDLAAEAEASESRRQIQIRTVLASSYTFAIDLNKRLDYDRVPADDDVDKGSTTPRWGRGTEEPTGYRPNTPCRFQPTACDEPMTEQPRHPASCRLIKGPLGYRMFRERLDGVPPRYDGNRQWNDDEAFPGCDQGKANTRKELILWGASVARSAQVGARSAARRHRGGRVVVLA